MKHNLRTISFIYDFDTTCKKGIEFLHKMSNNYPNYTVKMLSNVNDEYDFHYPTDFDLSEAYQKFSGQSYSTALLRDHENSCTFNPYDQVIEIKGNPQFQTLCEETWQAIQV